MGMFSDASLQAAPGSARTLARKLRPRRMGQKTARRWASGRCRPGRAAGGISQRWGWRWTRFQASQFSSRRPDVRH
eukprot:951633-Pyramimonas_sp.AAC.1